MVVSQDFTKYNVVTFITLPTQNTLGDSKMPFVKIIDTVGSSPESWEQAAKNAIEEASELPIFKRKGTITKATIKDFDVEIKDNKIAAYLCRVEMFLSGTD